MLLQPFKKVTSSESVLLSSSSWTVLILPFTLSLTAWTCLLVADATHHLELLDHDFLLRTSDLPWLAALGLFLVGWQVMTLAMMLPSTLPVVAMIGVDSPTREPCWKAQSNFIVGYALSWTLFALLAFVSDTFIHWLVRSWTWLALHSWVLAVFAVLLAELYQSTILKRRCLQQCFSSFLRCSSRMQATTLSGMRYGYFCVGSCWSLMFLLFAVGMKSPFAMAVVGLLILYEKSLPGDKRVNLLIGIIAVLLVGLWYVGTR